METLARSIFNSSRSTSPAVAGRPRTVVLRPNGSLDAASSPGFTQALAQALELTAETVAVDLLWVESVEPEGIACLVAGLKRAEAMGKTLSLRFMDVATSAAIQAASEHFST
jgi:anti-anti-sigma regulatory factor